MAIFAAVREAFRLGLTGFLVAFLPFVFVDGRAQAQVGVGGHAGFHGAGGHSGGHSRSHAADRGGKKGPREDVEIAGAFRNPVYWVRWPFAYYARTDRLARSCGEDITDIAGLPVDAYRAVVPRTDEIGAALDDLALAVNKATQDIKIACPAALSLTAAGRVAAMQGRIEAMIAAVELLEPALRRFYGLLSDEDKAKLPTVSERSRADNVADSPTPDCDLALLQSEKTELPADAIDRKVHLSDAQRAAVLALQTAVTRAAADLSLAICKAGDSINPPARLEAMHKRLDTMLAAVKTISAALNDVYATLTDKQRAKFEAIGPVSTGEAPPEGPPAMSKGPAPAVGTVKRFLPF
jgi:LTXXQ motif family protein